MQYSIFHILGLSIKNYVFYTNSRLILKFLYILHRFEKTTKSPLKIILKGDYFINIFNVYSDYDLTKKIGNVDFYGDIDIFDDEDKYFQEFKGKTGHYKLTFKQNEYNNWYWESTEVVK